MKIPKELLNKKFLVTGGNGFLGKEVCRKLVESGVKESNIYAPTSKEKDFRKLDDCKSALVGIDYVIHMAAVVGGIGFNREKPGELFYENAIMGVQLIEEARKANVEKLVVIGTICAYPKFTPVPFKEESLWDGYPEETNAPYGLAKKMLLVQAQAYRAQYGMNAIYLLPVNLYGHGDNFNPNSSHVIPALIKKFVEAKASNDAEVVIWGTGSATREFLFVEDAAEAIVSATFLYNEGDPVNIGSGSEISIKDLAILIKRLVGYDGNLVWDTTKPDGQPRRMLDTQRAQQKFGFKSSTTIEEGLKKTIDWYIKEIAS